MFTIALWEGGFCSLNYFKEITCLSECINCLGDFTDGIQVNRMATIDIVK